MSEERPCIGVTTLMTRILPFPFEKTLSLVAAHRTSFCEIHPCLSPVRKERDDKYITEQEWELAGNLVKFQVSFTVKRDTIEVEMSSAPLSGTAFMRFTPEAGGTQVFMEYDAGDFDNKKNYDGYMLSEFAGKYLDSTWNGYLLYLKGT